MRHVPFAEIDDVLQYFDDGYKISHDEAYRRFSEVSVLPPEELPADPFSPEYSELYMDLYKKISTRPEYSVQNERAHFDVEYHSRRPYPYFTKSLKRTAQHYDLMAKLFDMMDLEAGASILECGFGWGNTTVALCMLGYDVTALDIEDDYCALVAKRAEMLKIENLKFVNSDFLWVETAEETYDAVVYFESFHHCWEFDRLLKALHRVLKPGGKIYFGAEPINDQFTVPWGLRLDGEALFVARRAGWMELGFHTTFFEALLRRNGWRGQCVSPHFWIATRRSEPLVIPASDPRLGSQFGIRDGGKLVLNAGSANGERHYGLFGPYIGISPGIYDVTIRLRTETYDVGNIVFDICSHMGTAIHHVAEIDAGDLRSGQISAKLTVVEPLQNVEFRLVFPDTFAGEIETLTVTEIF